MNENEIVAMDAQQLSKTALTEYTPFQEQLAAFREEMGSRVYDLQDPDQLAQCKSDRLRLAKAITKLDNAHKDIKAPISSLVELLDERRREIKEPLDIMRQERLRLVKEHEERLAAIAQSQENAIQRIRGADLFQGVPTSEEIRERQKRLDAVELTEEVFGDHLENAKVALRRAIMSLDTMLATAEKQEAMQAELEELRRKQEEQEAKTSHERNEEVKAKLAEEAAAKAVEEERERVAAAQAAQEAQDAKRQSDMEHRRQCNREAVKAMCEASGISQEQAMKVLTAIVHEQVPRVRMNY